MLARQAAESGYKVAALDKLYGQGMDVLKPSGYGPPDLQLRSTHFFQIWFVPFNLYRVIKIDVWLNVIGFRTFLAAVLNGKESGFVDWFGILCSSWVAASRGTTARSWVLATGRVEYRSVQESNIMAARSADCTYISCIVHMLSDVCHILILEDFR